MTGAIACVVLAAFLYLITASTLADPAELCRRNQSEDLRSYYRCACWRDARLTRSRHYTSADKMVPAERLVFDAMIVHSRPDVVASIWALGLVAFYYIATILTYYLLQNLLGYAAFDASVLQGTPQVSLAPLGSTPL